MSLAQRTASKTAKRKQQIGGPRPEDQAGGSEVDIEDLGSRSASQESGEESQDDAEEPAQSPSAVSGVKAKTTQGRTTRSTTKLASITAGKEGAASPPPAGGNVRLKERNSPFGGSLCSLLIVFLVPQITGTIFP